MDHLILMTAGTGSSRFKITPIFGWVLLILLPFYFFFFKSQSWTLCEGFICDSSIGSWSLRRDIVDDDGFSAEDGARGRYSLSVKLALQTIYVFAPFLIILSQALNNGL